MNIYLKRCFVAAAVGSLLVASGCKEPKETSTPATDEATSKPQPDESSSTAPEPGKIAGPAAHKLVDDGATLLDVRTPGEYNSGHIDGAINIPIQAFGQKKEQLKKLEAPIVVYCQSGVRSARATEALEKLGFQKVYDLGGIGDW